MSFRLVFFDEGFKSLESYGGLSEEQVAHLFRSRLHDLDAAKYSEVTREDFVFPLEPSVRLNLVVNQLNRDYFDWNIAAASGWLAHDTLGGDRFAQYVGGNSSAPLIVNESCLIVAPGSDSIILKLSQSLRESIKNPSTSPAPTKQTDLLSQLFDVSQLTVVLTPLMAGAAGDKGVIVKSPRSAAHSKIALRAVPPVNLSIITRTRWERKQLLQRNIDSVHSLAKQSTPGFCISHHIVSDLLKPDWLKQTPATVHIMDFSHNADSRSVLINFALQKISAQGYVWFIDDDDFLNGEMFDLLESALRSRPSKPLVVLGAQQVIENPGWSFGKAAYYYRPERILDSYSFANVTPFSSVIFPAEKLVDYSSSVFEQMDFQEDHWLILSAMSASNITPTLINEPLVNISIRSNSNSSSSMNRSSRMAIESKLAWMWANSSNEAQFGLLMASKLNKQRKLSFRGYTKRIRALFSPAVWRSIAALKVPSRIIGGEFTASELREGLRKLG